MIAVFEHPLSLIYHIGKSLIVNGVDIFEKVDAAVNDYKSADYFDFGKELGMALDEVFLKSNATKEPFDENAYNFLDGFFTVDASNFNVDR